MINEKHNSKLSWHDYKKCSRDEEVSILTADIKSALFKHNGRNEEPRWPWEDYILPAIRKETCSRFDEKVILADSNFLKLYEGPETVNKTASSSPPSQIYSDSETLAKARDFLDNVRKLSRLHLERCNFLGESWSIEGLVDLMFPSSGRTNYTSLK